ncbi:MAG TPA: alpha/beta hydrolase, partial [Gaiellaceae bacterium]|nr:alpha/beta hydrolase [Gaiellaceae bacterium]
MISTEAAATAREQSRARYHDADGYVERDGVRTYWERYGEGAQTLLFVPPWAIVHSRCWKLQVPYLSRHFRVVTFDPRGNGRSDRPQEPEAYAELEYAEDALAVLDASETDRAVLVTLSLGVQRSLVLADRHPDRVEGLFVIAPALPLAPPHVERALHSFDDEPDGHEGWAKYNRRYWLRAYEDFLWFFFENSLNEPHSTKQTEDAVGWGLETTPETLIATELAPSLGEEAVRGLASRVRCPVLVVHGDRDRISPHARGVALADATGGTLVTLEGAGHLPQARDPVQINKLLREFAESVRPSLPPARSWRRAKRRRRRAVYVSSPIGLGHARRDVAIANELR